MLNNWNSMFKRILMTLSSLFVALVHSLYEIKKRHPYSLAEPAILLEGSLPNMFPCISRLGLSFPLCGSKNGRPHDVFGGVQTQRLLMAWRAYMSIVSILVEHQHFLLYGTQLCRKYTWRRLSVRLCAWIVLCQKPEKQNPGGASAPLAPSCGRPLGQSL